MKVLHVLDHSLPYFSGYSFRSDYIIRLQKRFGLQPVVVTSPKHEDFTSATERIEGVDYYRLRWPTFSSSPQLSQRLQAVPLVRQMSCVAALSKEITRLAEGLQVDLIHAHSPSLNGLAAARASQQLHLPWVYELRYYDEDAAVDRRKTRHNSLRYRMSQRLEQSALEQSHGVVTISSALREDLIGRGIAENKIFEVPNGVDTDFFQPLEPDVELIGKYRLTGKMVIGFIGSFYSYEGLKYLVEAILLLLDGRDDLVLLLAGEGEAEPELRAQIPESLSKHFVFVGKVPHDHVKRYYSVIDILVYPRVNSRLTELTTPLKPLEAMAMEKVVVGSNVRGIRELVRDGETGYLVEAENAQAIAARLEKLLNDETSRREVGLRARAYVKEERDWERIVERYLEVYNTTCGKRPVDSAQMQQETL
jgi:PEP-CTERM/exosortase A-associated glycosyltransferase